MRTLTAADFVAARYPMPLAADEIQLWFFPGSIRSGMRTDETWLRRLLAAHVDRSAAELTLARGEHGKPHLAPPLVLEFNLSNTRGGAK